MSPIFRGRTRSALSRILCPAAPRTTAFPNPLRYNTGAMFLVERRSHRDEYKMQVARCRDVNAHLVLRRSASYALYPSTESVVRGDSGNNAWLEKRYGRLMGVPYRNFHLLVHREAVEKMNLTRGVVKEFEGHKPRFEDFHAAIWWGATVAGWEVASRIFL